MALDQELGWDELDEVEFEKLIYDLLHELGYTNVVWRKGTPKKSTTPDSGRDIEAQLLREDPDGNKHLERWFVQAKHYSSAVSPSDFKDAITWAEAKRPNVLLLTVSALSNSSRDFIETYERETKPHFRIKAWERPEIERLLARFPSLLSKYFPERDPLKVMLQHAEMEFRQHGVLIDVDRLNVLWEGREALRLQDRGLEDQKFVILLSEYGLGDSESRRWLNVFPDDEIAVMLPAAILFFATNLTTAMRQERKWASLDRKGIFRVLPAILHHLMSKSYKPKLVAQLLWSPHKVIQTGAGLKVDRRNARTMRELFYLPLIFRPLLNSILEVCATTCGGGVGGEGQDGKDYVGSMPGIQCKLNVVTNWGGEFAEEAQTNPMLQLCPAFVLSLITRGIPPRDDLRLTKAEFDRLMKEMELFISRQAALASDPAKGFEPATVL